MASDLEVASHGARFQPLIQAIEAERTADGASAIAVAVIEDGKLSFARGFGTKAAGGADPTRASTLFRIGSVTKMMTATALLQQVAAGRVELSAPVTRYVPDFHFDLDPSWAPSITVRELLTHSTGMYDLLTVNVPDAEKTDGALRSFMTTTFGQLDFLMVPAGTFYNYSNPNYYVAGLIAETIAGKPYRTVMRQRVFAPLEMRRTLFLGAEVLADGDYAVGANVIDPTVPAAIEPDSYDNAWARPAGYAWSNVFDLARFVEFLMTGDHAVLPSSLRMAMQTRQIDTLEAADLTHYGYGLGVQDGVFIGTSFYRIPVVTHDGALPGFSSAVVFLPSLKFGIIVLTNVDNARFTNTLVTAIATLARLPAPSTPPDLSVDPATFPAYAGVYHDPFLLGDITVTAQGTALTVDIPGLAALGITYDPVLVATAPANFVLTVNGNLPLGVTFLSDGQPQAKYFRTRVAVAIRTTAPATLPAAAALSTAERAARLQDALRHTSEPLLAPQSRPAR